MAVLSSRLSHYSNILPLSAPGSLIRVNDAHKVGFIVTFICQCLLWSLSCPRLHTYPHTRLEIINNIKLHRFGVKAFNSGKVCIGTVWERVRISLIIPMYIRLELNIHGRPRMVMEPEKIRPCIMLLITQCSIGDSDVPLTLFELSR